MIKFTDEQKRELLTEYKELLTKSISCGKVLEDKKAEYENALKSLEEAESDLSKYTDEEWGYVFACTLFCSSIDSKTPNDNWGWVTLLAIMALFAGYPSSPNDGKLN